MVDTWFPTAKTNASSCGISDPGWLQERRSQILGIMDGTTATAALAHVRRILVRHFRPSFNFLIIVSDYKPHPDDTSLQTYRGHRVLQTLIRCYFSPQSTTGQKCIPTIKVRHRNLDWSRYLYWFVRWQCLYLWCFNWRNRVEVEWSRIYNTICFFPSLFMVFLWCYQTKIIRDLSWHPYDNQIVSTSVHIHLKIAKSFFSEY